MNCSALMSMLPTAAGKLGALTPLLAVSVPLFITCPLASSTMRPPRLAKPVASMRPELFTTALCKRLAAWADKITNPPGAMMACLFSTKVLMVAGVTRTLLSAPLPSNCNSYASPAAKATVPRLATITPLLRTSGANKAMNPPSAARSSPSFSTLPVAPLRLNLSWPLRYSSATAVCVVATKPPTSTLDDLPKYTPCGLTKITCPGAVMRPKIWLGCMSITRFKVDDCALGCWKLTVAFCPTLKLLQSTMARWLVWFTFSVLPDWLMLAWPVLTTPPVGSCVEATVDCAHTTPCAKQAIATVVNTGDMACGGNIKRRNFTPTNRNGKRILKSKCKQVVISNYFCGFS